MLGVAPEINDRGHRGVGSWHIQGLIEVEYHAVVGFAGDPKLRDPALVHVGVWIPIAGIVPKTLWAA